MDAPGFSIRSTSSDREVVFSQFRKEDETLRVDLTSHEFSAASIVSVYTDAFGLDNLFQELGNLERPWSGVKGWAGIEGDFSIAATSTSLGEVTFRVSLSVHAGSPEEWRIDMGVTTDFGQLSKIAAMSRAFFHESVT